MHKTTCAPESYQHAHVYVDNSQPKSIQIYDNCSFLLFYYFLFTIDVHLTMTISTNKLQTKTKVHREMSVIYNNVANALVM